MIPRAMSDRLFPVRQPNPLLEGVIVGCVYGVMALTLVLIGAATLLDELLRPG